MNNKRTCLTLFNTIYKVVFSKFQNNKFKRESSKGKSMNYDKAQDI